jgi:hypothetical protein
MMKGIEIRGSCNGRFIFRPKREELGKKWSLLDSTSQGEFKIGLACSIY